MKNRAIKSVIAAATSLALLGSGIAVAQDSDNSTQTQSANTTSSEKQENGDNSGSSSLESALPHTEINGKETTGLIAAIGALNMLFSVIGSILSTVLNLAESFQKLAPKPADAK